LNPRPEEPHSSALPTELHPPSTKMPLLERMVELSRFSAKLKHRGTHHLQQYLLLEKMVGSPDFRRLFQKSQGTHHLQQYLLLEKMVGSPDFRRLFQKSQGTHHLQQYLLLEKMVGSPDFRRLFQKSQGTHHLQHFRISNGGKRYVLSNQTWTYTAYLLSLSDLKAFRLPENSIFLNSHRSILVGNANSISSPIPEALTASKRRFPADASA
jgi:hypothetical protein